MDIIENLDLNLYYTIYTHIHEMLDDRGYLPLQEFMDHDVYISNYTGLIATVKSEKHFINKLSLLFETNDEPVKRLLVYFHILEPKLRKVDMEYVYKKMKQKEAMQLLLVTRDKVTPYVNDILAVLGHNVQTMEISELLVNPTYHQFVPKYYLLTPERKEELLKVYAVTEEKIPTIYTTDPIVRYYNWKIGDMVKIVRSNGSIYYRVVTVPMKDN